MKPNRTIEEQRIDKILELTSLCKEHSTFEFEGLLIDGYTVDTVKMYVDSNPSKKFRTWLVDKNLVLKEI